MKILTGFVLTCIGAAAFAQTDETIFREFRFDFSTPGARANAMGRAFVGLSDEATAAYNNPAGLSILNSPEFSIEYRHTESSFDALSERGPFTLTSGNPAVDTTVTKRASFASFSATLGEINFSAYFVNHLNYQRPLTESSTIWLYNDGTDDGFYEFSYTNKHKVDLIGIDTHGVSVSHQMGNLSLGLSVGFSTLEIDYEYNTSLSSEDLAASDVVRSSAQHRSTKATYVMGFLYRFNSKWQLALSAKRQPVFSYPENVNRTLESPEETAITVRFKVPDSYQLGLAYKPNDYWTFVADVDWVRYKQLSDQYFTVLSVIDLGGAGDNFFQFNKDDYTNNEDPALHLGGEYLWPRGKNIFAFRAGWFSDPDHKTRFVGDSSKAPPNQIPIYTLQDFIFNTGDQSADYGQTYGLGYVWNNRIQIDAAYVKTDRFKWLVTSLLYRF